MNIRTVLGAGIAITIATAAIWIWQYEKAASERAAQSAIAPNLPLPAEPLEARIDSGMVSLFGPVPDEETRNNLVEEAKRRFGANNVTDALTVTEAVSGQLWYHSDALFLPLAVKGIKQGVAQFDGTKLTLEGFAASDVVRADVEAAAVGAIGGRFGLVNRVQIALVPAPDTTVTTAPQRTAVASKALQQRIDDLLAGKSIDFEGSSASLTARSMSVLEQLAPILAQSDARIEVSGHTDDKGDAEKNVRLSGARAEEVCRYLVRYGVAPNRLLPRGYGAARAVALAISESDVPQFRRIEFRVLEGR